ncbi:MAG: helix-turn-helix domain-containing protein [Cyclobacteriaceae bacterium]
MRTKLKDISIKQKVLNYLKRYGSINKQTALTHAGCWNLSTIIHNLRKENYDIRTENGKRHNVKYVLYDKEVNKPVFSRFIKPKTEQ